MGVLFVVFDTAPTLRPPAVPALRFGQIAGDNTTIPELAAPRPPRRPERAFRSDAWSFYTRRDHTEPSQALDCSSPRSQASADRRDPRLVRQPNSTSRVVDQPAAGRSRFLADLLWKATAVCAPPCTVTHSPALAALLTDLLSVSDRLSNERAGAAA